MNYKEFRPGNLVNVSGKPEKITGILQFGMYFNLMYYPFNLSQIEPIPLTEEWLLKFGFEKRESSVCNYWWNGINEFTHDWLVDLTEMYDNGQIFYRNQKHTLKYVHQLQNLFFALTGNELTIEK